MLSEDVYEAKGMSTRQVGKIKNILYSQMVPLGRKWCHLCSNALVLRVNKRWMCVEQPIPGKGMSQKGKTHLLFLAINLDGVHTIRAILQGWDLSDACVQLLLYRFT